MTSAYGNVITPTQQDLELMAADGPENIVTSPAALMEANAQVLSNLHAHIERIRTGELQSAENRSGE